MVYHYLQPSPPLKSGLRTCKVSRLSVWIFRRSVNDLQRFQRQLFRLVFYIILFRKIFSTSHENWRGFNCCRNIPSNLSWGVCVCVWPYQLESRSDFCLDLHFLKELKNDLLMKTIFYVNLFVGVDVCRLGRMIKNKRIIVGLFIRLLYYPFTIWRLFLLWLHQDAN